MLPIKPSPFLSTRTVVRAMSVEPSETPEPVEKAVAEYDRERSAAVAGLFALPTAGLSLLCYGLYHAKQAEEKLPAMYSLARAIVSARTTLSSGGGSKFRAGGFIFTEVIYQNALRVEVKRESIYARAQAIKEMYTLEEEDGALEETSAWEAFRRWLPCEPEPVIRLPGDMTLQDVKLRAANLIITKTQAQAREHILAHQAKLGDKENDIITMVGIYALAEVSPPSQKGNKDLDCQIQERIQENSDSIKSLKEIFGFSKPGSGKQSGHLKAIQNMPAQFAQTNEVNDPFIRRDFIATINCCFNALNDLY